MTTGGCGPLWRRWNRLLLARPARRFSGAVMSVAQRRQRAGRLDEACILLAWLPAAGLGRGRLHVVCVARRDGLVRGAEPQHGLYLAGGDQDLVLFQFQLEIRPPP